jgi:hypothetical protein
LVSVLVLLVMEPSVLALLESEALASILLELEPSVLAMFESVPSASVLSETEPSEYRRHLCCWSRCRLHW